MGLSRWKGAVGKKVCKVQDTTQRDLEGAELQDGTEVGTLIQSYTGDISLLSSLNLEFWILSYILGSVILFLCSRDMGGGAKVSKGIHLYICSTVFIVDVQVR